MYRHPRSPSRDRVVFLRACDVIVEALESRQMLSAAGAPPNGPYGLVVTPIGPEIQFIDNADNETGFEIDRRTLDGRLDASFNVAASPGVGGTVTFIDPTPLPNTTYRYTALAFTTQGIPVGSSPVISSVAGPVTVTTPSIISTPPLDATNPGGAPNGPYGLTVDDITPSSVHLAWTDYASNETGFAIERAASPNGPFVRVFTTSARAGTGTQGGFTDGTVLPGNTYYYRVFAVNGPYQSSINGPVAVTTPGSPLTNPGGAPNGPFGLSVIHATPSSISLAFTDYATNETGFVIRRSTSPFGSPFLPVATLPPSAGSGGTVTFTDTGLPPGATYWYEVYAVNGPYQSSHNGPIMATTTNGGESGPGLPNPGGAPNGPYGLEVTAVPTLSATQRPVQVSFIDNASNETSLKVEYAFVQGGPWFTLATLPPSPGTGQRVTFTDSEHLPPGATAYVRVYAENGPYQSSIAGPVAVMTAPDYLSHTFVPLGRSFITDDATGFVRTAFDAASGNFYTLSTDSVTNGTSHGPTIERWNATTGLIDTSFGSNGRAYVNDLMPSSKFQTVTGIAVQSSGKIIVAGNVLTVPGVRNMLFIRLNPDGTLDTTFNNGVGFQEVLVNTITQELDEVADVAVSPTDQIYIGGSYSNNTSNGSDFFAARFDPNGNLDSSFGPHGIVNGPLSNNATATAHRIAIDGDGSVIVVGSRLANASDNIYGERLNPNGTVTDAFSVSTLIGEAAAEDVLIQPDHKIVVAGKLANQAVAYRRNPDGTADSTWVGLGASAPPQNPYERAGFDAIERLADGSYFAAGLMFDPLLIGTGSDDFLAAKLKPDGSLDTTFGKTGFVRTDFGGPDDEATSLVLPSDGNPIAAGASNGHALFAKYKVI
jgi:uncharacterized delta-60 repeat protein